MKTLITLVVLAFAYQSFGSVQPLADKLDKMIIEDTYDEFELSYSIYKGVKDEVLETGDLVKSVLDDYTIGLESMNLSIVHDEKDALEFFDFNSYPFFCERLVKNNESKTYLSDCQAKVEEIIAKAYSLNNGDVRVSIFKMEGNYYGDWENLYLIVEDWDNREAIVIYFDVLHEI